MPDQVRHDDFETFYEAVKIECLKIFKGYTKKMILLSIYQSDLLPGAQTACKQRALELSSHYCYVKNNTIPTKILW